MVDISLAWHCLEKAQKGDDHQVSPSDLVIVEPAKAHFTVLITREPYRRSNGIRYFFRTYFVSPSPVAFCMSGLLVAVPVSFFAFG